MTWMTVLAGTTALMLAASTLAAPAQETSGTAEPGQSAVPSRDDMGGRVNPDPAGFKETLRLTPEQERYWPTFESALRDLIRLRLERADRPGQAMSGNPVDRLRGHAEELAGVAAALNRLAEAAAPLYGSLDDRQKQRFDRVAGIARQRVAMMLERRLRDQLDPMPGARGFDERDGRGDYRYGNDESRRGQQDMMADEMRRMYRQMMRMYGDLMRRGQNGDEDRRGWGDRQPERWSDRDRDRSERWSDRQSERWNDRDRWQRPHGRGMDGRGGRDRYEDDE